jgi:PAS domain S-box-containing protein
MRPESQRRGIQRAARSIVLSASLIAGFLITTQLFALDPSAANSQYNYSFWMSDDGLPQNTVVSIAQTADGYLWFGTEEGLARFDGVRFTTFYEKKTISALLASRDGSLWISVNDGVSHYKDRQMTHYSRRDGLREGRIYSMSEGSDGSIWMATRTGLNRFHRGKFSAPTVTDGSSETWIWATSVTRDGALWWGTNGGGLKRLFRGAVTTFTTREGLADNIVLAIQEDRNGNLWVGTNRGLSRIQDGKISTFSAADGFPGHPVKAVQEDRDGNIWIGTETGGLHRYAGGRVTSFGAHHRLSNAAVLSLLEGREGDLWIGTSGEGLSQLRPSKFVTVGKSEGLNTDMVWSVRESNDHSLLMGTNRGFSRWKDGVLTTLTVRDGLSSNNIRSVIEDRSGGIWLGTNEGVNLVKNGKVTVYRTSDGLPDNTIRTLTEDREGNVWIGTRGGGLARYRDGVFKVFNKTNGLPGDVVASVDEDRDGKLWIGTSEGLSVFHKGVFTNYSTKDGMSSNAVRVTYHDRQGGHWVGTYGSGLHRFKNGRISTITEKDGLFDDLIFAIVEDRSGNLWMTCNRGVSRVSITELNDFADGKIKRVHATSFDATDGMKAAECNGGSPGAWAGSDGRLFFATIKGVAIIDPENIPLNTLPPPVWNEEVLVDGVETSSGIGLTLSPGKHNLEIRYTALSFIEPKKVQFHYRLKGFSEQWVDAGNRRTAFFTNLPPGNYTFEVMGSNNDGTWSRVGNPLALHVQAAFFQTVWFRIACLVVLLLAVRAAFKIRTRYLRDRERLLVKRVDEQTAELTAGKAAAEAVAEINTHLRLKNELILNSIADGVFGVDLSGNITLDNPAAARMLGWHALELVGRQADDTIHHPAAGAADSGTECPMHQTLSDGVLRQVSSEVFWRKDGSSFPVDYLVAPIRDSKGRVTGVAVTFRDITAQKAVERMKDEFVSTVSHELRTPLTSIRGALGLLSSGMLGTIAEKGQRMLQIAVTNTDRLVRLINDILDLERIDSGKVELSRSDVEAGALMTQAVDGVQSMADEAGVRLAIRPARAILWIDSDRIMQTLTNLLSNAIKFSPSGTTVTLSGTSDANSDFTFRVADQGRGVPADKLDTIFERFKQVDASDSRDKGGSGLGLAICRSIVTAHQGRIWAEKNTPEGSLFQFSLPILQKPVITLEGTNEIRTKTLVVCCDEGPALPPIVQMLEKDGFNVVRVMGVNEVESRAAAIAPDAIILDLAMNRGNVWRVVAALKANAQTREIPIVVASSESPESYASDAAGIAGWVRKPFLSEDLLNAVTEVCEMPTVVIVEDDLDLAGVMTAALESHGIRTVHASNGKEAVNLCVAHDPVLIVLDLVLPDMDGFAIVDILRKQQALRATPLLVYSAREVGFADQARLKLGPTEFLTKGRGSLHDFESRVIRLLKTVTSHDESTNQAA